MFYFYKAAQKCGEWKANSYRYASTTLLEVKYMVEQCYISIHLV